MGIVQKKQVMKLRIRKRTGYGSEQRLIHPTVIQTAFFQISEINGHSDISGCLGTNSILFCDSRK